MRDKNNSFNVGGNEEKTKIFTFDSLVIIINNPKDSKNLVDTKVIIFWYSLFQQVYNEMFNVSSQKTLNVCLADESWEL